MYERLCEVIFNRYKNKVKYWLTFNEINMLLHLPFVGAGLVFEEGDNQEAIKYQAAHHQLIASAKVTELAHDINSEFKIGCMLAAGNTYGNTCAPEDVWESMGKDRENYFFIDVQSRGKYPSYAKKMLEKNNIVLEMEDGDEELLAKNTVDFISFSYYASRLTSADPEVNAQTEDKDNEGNGTLKRSKKKSFDWYKKVIESNDEQL